MRPPPPACLRGLCNPCTCVQQEYSTVTNDIPVRIDSKRGCGWRSEGGLYLTTSGFNRGCGLMPIPLYKCPTCSHGFEPTRSHRVINPGELFKNYPQGCEHDDCITCPVAVPRRDVLGQAYLMWCGKTHYPTPDHWLEEARKQGVSRRIKNIPKGFVLGHSWIFMAHESSRSLDLFTPDGFNSYDLHGAIYSVFQPEAIEYVVRGDETPEQLDAMRGRGITPVRVIRDTDVENADTLQEDN